MAKATKRMIALGVSPEQADGFDGEITRDGAPLVPLRRRRRAARWRRVENARHVLGQRRPGEALARVGRGPPAAAAALAGRLTASTSASASVASSSGSTSQPVSPS